MQRKCVALVTHTSNALFHTFNYGIDSMLKFMKT
jgi:hypothetical protein